MDGGIIKGLKTSQAQKSAHTESFPAPELGMKSTLCCLLTPLSQPLLESLGFSLKVLQSHHLHRAQKLYSRCAVPASSWCCFHAQGMEHFSKTKSHKGQLNRRFEKAQNSSFFLLSCHFLMPLLMRAIANQVFYQDQKALIFSF